ncbi:MAG: HD domain-containing protein [Deltaproteobacteria bacterium]|jgi:3'-5' exoribonuclease|nr:HD domain-containing protein [Deltaproteobacteria bacterium]
MKVNKTAFVKDLVDGQEISAPFAIKRLDVKTKKNGEPYLNLELADKTGSMSAKIWNNVEHMAEKLKGFKVGVFAGRTQIFNGALQMNVRNAVPVPEGDYDEGFFRATSDKPAGRMRDDLVKLAGSIADPDYRAITKAVLDSPKAARFWEAPAAKQFHHSTVSGLLEHTLSVATLADKAAAHYGTLLDRSLLLSGAILHDMGKIWEFNDEMVTDITTPGRLLGHVSIGTIFVTEIAGGIPGFPPMKLTLLQHMILSHHGKKEFGSPVTPQILEAAVLHALDDLDGKLTGIATFIAKEAKPPESPDREAWTGWNKLLDSFFMTTPRFDAPAGVKAAAPAFSGAAGPRPVPAAPSARSAAPAPSAPPVAAPGLPPKDKKPPETVSSPGRGFSAPAAPRPVPVAPPAAASPKAKKPPTISSDDFPEDDFPDFDDPPSTRDLRDFLPEYEREKEIPDDFFPDDDLFPDFEPDDGEPAPARDAGDKPDGKEGKGSKKNGSPPDRDPNGLF